ncbi:MAG: mechanosensitive ion channel family protein [Rhizobiaceae bacterium]|nr:mechanosensitive ion channel family protein [Hyphomicrobiales bacterium]NRB32784.1 mechanosensitive ion channel family protein [Rhizobiaceae bacterium]
MTYFRSFLSIIALTFVLIGLIPSSGTAQTLLPQATSEANPVTDEPPSPNDVKELIRLLEDQRIKNWLEKGAQDLSVDSESGSEIFGEGLKSQFSAALDRTRERARLLQGAWRHLPDAPELLAAEWRESIAPGGTVRSLTYVLIFLFIGGGLEWLYRQYTNSRLLRLQLTHPVSLSGRVRAALSRALLIFGGLAVFTLGSIGGFLSFDWDPFVEELVLILLLLVLALRAIATLSMFFLAPRVRELRLAPFESVLAKQLHFTVIIALSIMAIALAVSDVFAELTEEGAGLAEVQAAAFSVSIFAGLICLVTALVAIWLVAGLVTVDPDETNKESAAAVNQRVFKWRLYLIVLTVATFVLWLFAATDLMWTVLILGLLPAALGLIQGWVNYFFDESESYLLGQNREMDEVSEEVEEIREGEAAPAELVEEVAEPSDVDERRPYDTVRLVTVRFLRILLVISSVLIVLAAWGTDVFSLADSPTFYGKVTSVIVELIVAVLIADLIWTWAKAAIDRRLADYKPPEGPQAPGPEARMATLLPLLRVILLITLVVMVGLSILSSAGVNIAPLIAGAGVLGVAIGFGAQSLVKDIVSGIFFLVDDAFRIGEYIEIGNLRGVVEGMSIRSLRLRHHLGAVHTIPFGELTSLTNYSRDWVILRMEFRVPFETDIKLVKKLIKRIGAEMLEDPMYKDGFIQPLKSQGVRRMEEFNMVVGVKFMAKPGEQWVIRRDAYQKIVNAFEANGIRLAERNVKVQVVSDRPLTDEEQEAVVGAAQEAIEQKEASGPPPDEP